MRRLICMTACALFLVSCTGGEEPGSRERSGPSFKPPDFAPGSVLFVRGTSLILFDAESREERQIAELGSADAAVSPDGALVAHVESAAEGKEDFVEDPVLRILEISSGDESEIGSGHAPSFSPSGELLAYQQPVGDRACEGEVCTGDARVMAGRPGGEARELLGPGRWVSLGWVGERLLIVDQDDPTEVQTVAPGSERMSLGISPASLWGGSPTGNRLLLVSANAAEFRSLEDAGVSPGGTLVALNGTLGQGAWSPDGAVVAASLLGEPKGGIPKTELVTIAAGETTGSRVQTIPRSSGAAGQVLWSRSGEALVYVKSAPPKGLNLQAVACSDPPEGACERLFDWKRGVRLLHLY